MTTALMKVASGNDFMNRRARLSLVEIDKSSNPFWDGDGVQGVGQARDHTGKWVALPGSHALKKIGVWELDDGSFGVFENGKQEPSKTYKTKHGALKYAAKVKGLDNQGMPRRGSPFGADKHDVGKKFWAGNQSDQYNKSRAVDALGSKIDKMGTESQRLAWFAPFADDTYDSDPYKRTEAIKELMDDLVKVKAGKEKYPHWSSMKGKPLNAEDKAERIEEILSDIEWNLEEFDEGYPQAKRKNTEAWAKDFLKREEKKQGGSNEDAKNRAAYERYRGDVFYGDTSKATPGKVIAQMILDTWAETSGDSDPLSNVLQHRAEELFSLGGSHKSSLMKWDTPKKKKPGWQRGPDGPSEIYSASPELWDKIIQQIYKDTQADLKKKGIKEVTLYRGMYLPSSTKIDAANLSSQPLSSWSTDPGTAAGFGDITFKTVFKREDIWATALTGPGCTHEFEFVVLGGTTVADKHERDFGGFGAPFGSMGKKVPAKKAAKKTALKNQDQIDKNLLGSAAANIDMADDESFIQDTVWDLQYYYAKVHHKMPTHDEALALMKKEGNPVTTKAGKDIIYEAMEKNAESVANDPKVKSILGVPKQAPAKTLATKKTAKKAAPKSQEEWDKESLLDIFNYTDWDEPEDLDYDSYDMAYYYTKVYKKYPTIADLWKLVPEKDKTPARKAALTKKLKEHKTKALLQIKAAGIKIAKNNLPTLLIDTARDQDWLKSLHPDQGDCHVGPTRIKKSNPTWDGDGVQGAGQPRDRTGRWVALPGPTDIKRIASFDLDDGTFGIFVDDERRAIKKYKTRNGANRAVADAIKADRDAYVESEKGRKKALASLRRKVAAENKKKAEGEAERKKEEAEEQKKREQIFGTPKKKKVKTKGVEQKGPKPRSISRKVTVTDMDRLPFPGRPSDAQLKETLAWAKNEFLPEEANYAGLIARLLKKRGVTQDPSIRGDMARRYGIPAGRLVQIELDVNDHLFPGGGPAQKRVPNLRGEAPHISPKQMESMKELGARRGIPEEVALGDTTFRPSRVFKIQKGPKRGRWARVNWGGDVDLITKKEAEKAVRNGKQYWTDKLLRDKAGHKKMVETRRQNMRDFLEKHKEPVPENIGQLLGAYNKLREKLDKGPFRKYQIAQAKKWARSKGLDGNDSYWWAFYWNDTSLLLGSGIQDKMKSDPDARQLQINLAEAMEREHMDPALLEGILAMPDIDSRDMRGHRPGSKKAVKGDEDFEEASAESRETDPDWEAKNKDRAIEHSRKIREAYRKYKIKNPTSRMTLEQFTDDYYNKKIRIPGGVKKSRNPRWDGDGVQGVGQPRNRSGQWSRGGALTALGGELIERGVMQHTGTVARSGGGAASLSGVFDHKNKTIKVKFKPLQGRKHKLEGPDGKPLAKKHYEPGQAAYLRNNGPTKITDARLKALNVDRSKATQQERDLLLSAAAQKHIDGDKMIRVWSIKHREFKPRPRYEVMANIAREMWQDSKRKDPNARRGAGGQVISHEGKKADAKRKQENKKVKDSGRSLWESKTKRQWLLDEFGDGETAICILCGNKKKPLKLEEVSPERIRPGGNKGEFGGKYVVGNVAPAHWSCNVNGGTSAQWTPQQYYDDNLRQMFKVYKGWIDAGYPMGSVLKKHKKEFERLGLM